jgi:mannose-6-phosphate isomerase-like protein (cupin superfamily)
MRPILSAEQQSAIRRSWAEMVCETVETLFGTMPESGLDRAQVVAIDGLLSQAGRANELLFGDRTARPLADYLKGRKVRVVFAEKDTRQQAHVGKVGTVESVYLKYESLDGYAVECPAFLVSLPDGELAEFDAIHLRLLSVEGRARTAPRVVKPWGWEERLCESEYSMKGLFVEEGCRTSWHFHLQKKETVLVVAGECELHVGSLDDESRCERVRLGVGMYYHVFPSVRHRWVNRGKGLLVLHEAGTPHGDEDTVRLSPGGKEPTAAPTHPLLHVD